MVEPLRAAVLDRDQDARDYKPLALLAVAAFAVSLLFSGVVLILTIWGLITRKPFLEPWLIPLAFSGVLLSIAARWQITLSEGTREGRRLASTAWWLSVVGGAMYAAFYYGNVAAIQGQARRFAKDAMLTKLQEQKWEEAFAATIRPNQRKGMNIADIRRRFGDVVAPFRMESLPHLYERAGGIAEVEDVGTANWEQKTDGLTVNLRFLIYTPEGMFEAVVPTVGVENAETGEREWFIERQGGVVKMVSLTSYGGMLSKLQEEADPFLSSWLHEKRFPARRIESYFDALPLTRDERKRRARTFEARAFVAPVFADLASTSMGNPGPLLFLARMRNFDQVFALYEPKTKDEVAYIDLPRHLVHWDESKQKQDQLVKDQMVPFMLMPEYSQGSQNAATQGPGKTRIEITPTRIRASTPIDVSLPILKYRCTGRIYADCTEPKLVAELNRLKNALREGDGEQGAQLVKSTPHDWVISELLIDLARDMGDQRPPSGGPGPAIKGGGVRPGQK